MTTMAPVVVFLRQKGTDRWKIELRNFASFRSTLGPDVVTAFCRCFVHSDRLTSLISFGYSSSKMHGKASIGFSRNLQTMVWFAIGTLRELALAIRDLRSALAKRGMLDAQSKSWLALREVENRWENDPSFREMRNMVAYHVDAAVIERGLIAMEAQGNVVLCEGQGEDLDDSTMRLGLEALLNGSGKSLPDFDRLMKTVSEDHGISSTIQEAFLEVLGAKGVKVEGLEA